MRILRLGYAALSGLLTFRPLSCPFAFLLRLLRSLPTGAVGTLMRACDTIELSVTAANFQGHFCVPSGIGGRMQYHAEQRCGIS
jgi:hypothetical protein